MKVSDATPAVNKQLDARRLFIVLCVALMAWVLPVAHAMPIDADGPDGLSDNADLDDLILSFTSPTAAVAPRPVVAIPASFREIDTVASRRPIGVIFFVQSTAESRGPPPA